MSTASSLGKWFTSKAKEFEELPVKRFLLIMALCAPVASIAESDSAPFHMGQCYRAMWSDARAKPAADRFGMGQQPIPLALRSSKAKANAKEKESLEFIAAAMQNCQGLDQPNRANYHPLVKQMVEAYEAGFREVLTRIYAGDLAWGAAIAANEENSAIFEKRRIELIAMAEAQQSQQAQAEKEAAEAKKVAAEAEYQRRAALRADFERQQRQEELARQQQANQDIANGLLLLQMARPQPSLNCRSTRFFDTVNTTCN